MASSPPRPSTMKAATQIGPGPLEKTLKVRNDVPMPKNSASLPKSSVLVKVAYTSLNPVDYKIPEIPLLGRAIFKGIPCLDFAGVVEESQSPRLKKGDSVYGQTQPPTFAACAEYVVVASEHVMRVPDGVKLEHAATLGIAGITAYQTIVPFVKAGDKIFVNGGSGGVGTFAIQIAKAIGCYVTTTCSTANVELCKSLGADEVLDYRVVNVIETLTQSGKMYDHIVDNVFSDAQLYWSCAKYLNSGGTFVTIAGTPKLSFIKDVASIFLWPRFLGGGQRPFKFVGRQTVPDQYERIAQWIKDGTVKVVIEDIFDLEDVSKAFSRLKSGRTVGKLVIKIN